MSEPHWWNNKVPYTKQRLQTDPTTKVMSKEKLKQKGGTIKHSLAGAAVNQRAKINKPNLWSERLRTLRFLHASSMKLGRSTKAIPW